MTAVMNAAVLKTLAVDRVLAVVRAPSIPDPAALCAALASGGIHTIEFTFTTPDLPRVIAAAVSRGEGTHIGAGTVLTANQASAAIEVGAEFLVTPALRPEVAEVAARHGIPVVMGALTPTEYLQAVELGAAAVKVFPASAFGPEYLKALRGPFPAARLIPSGGVDSGNAREYLAHGAFAVSAGTEVVPPSVVASGASAEIARRANLFTAAINSG